MIKNILVLLLSFILQFQLFSVPLANTYITKKVVSDTVTESQQKEQVCEYVYNHLSINVDISKTSIMYSIDNSPNAYLYEFDSGGYAVVDIPSNTIMEVNIENAFPETIKKLFYFGLFNYVIKQNGKFVNVFNNSITFNENEARQLDNQLNQKRTDNAINGSNSSLYSAASTITDSGQLNNSLSTSWVNGYCGPTAAYIMLAYRGLISTANPYSSIMLMNSYCSIGGGVSLTSLRNGINNYLSDYGYANISVASLSSFSMNKVKQQIDLNRPIELGGQIFSSGAGHCVVIHKYEIISSGSYVYFYLYVNNGYGSNNVLISSEALSIDPTNWSDHVYFAS